MYYISNCCKNNRAFTNRGNCQLLKLRMNEGSSELPDVLNHCIITGNSHSHQQNDICQFLQLFLKIKSSSDCSCK